MPIDHFTRAFLALLDSEPEGGIFHITSNEALPLATVVDYTGRLYGVRGLETVPAEAFRERSPTALESLFDGYTAAYRPYMRDRRRFESRAARPALEAAGVSCPPLTYDSFARLMRYAESVAWGKRLFG